MDKKHESNNFFHTGRITDYLSYKGLIGEEKNNSAGKECGEEYVYKN